MEGQPLADDFTSISVILCSVPKQHLWPKINPNFLAIGLNNPRGLIQQVFCINHTEVSIVEDTLRKQEVEQGAKLVIADFRRDEVVVVGLVTHGRRGEMVHTGSTQARVPDEERPLVGAEDVDGDDRRVGRFCVRVIGQGGCEAEISISAGA